MRVVALAGGVGAGKFLRGLQGVARAEGLELAVVVNTADDLQVYGLHVCPDLDSVCYWLAGLADRERGWGLAGETFHAMEALRATLGEEAWFSLGDRDLATHLFRTERLRAGLPLSAVTEELRTRLGLPWRILPMSDDPVTTRVEVADAEGRGLDLHFQEYWVRRGARDAVKAVRYAGVERARPAPGVLEALGAAEAVILCPSNPVASLWPILAVPGVREAVAARRGRVVGISPIVAGAPLRGMADRLMPPAGLEVSALGAARAYAGLLAGWVVDERDRDLAPRIQGELGVGVAVTDTIMVDDPAAEALARAALALLP